MKLIDRRRGQAVVIRGDIRVTVVKLDRGKVRLGIEADRSIPISRPDAKRSARAGAAGEG